MKRNKLAFRISLVSFILLLPIGCRHHTAKVPDIEQTAKRPARAVHIVESQEIAPKQTHRIDSLLPRISFEKTVCDLGEVGQDTKNTCEFRFTNTGQGRLKFYVAKYQKTAPMLSEWMDENLPEGLTVFALPVEHRRRMRTTNMLERVHEEINRRTRVAGLFPNEASLLRLVSAILMELSEEWETGIRYLNMDVENDDSASEQNKIYRKNVA
jgi:hypothetical protein